VSIRLDIRFNVLIAEVAYWRYVNCQPVTIMPTHTNWSLL